MLDFAITFLESYTILFYALLVVAVILEGPLVILAISLLADKLGLDYYQILVFAFIGDFGGDLLHFFLGRSSKKFILRMKKVGSIRYIYEMMENYSFLDKLIIIKYTPPLTSIGLLYMGFSKVSTKEFITKDVILCCISSFIISSIGYIIGKYFISSQQNFWYIIVGIGVSIIVLYFFTRYLMKFIPKYIKKKHNDT